MGAESLSDINEFKSYVGGQIRGAKRKYFKNKLDMCVSNSLKIWKIYNNILGKERKSRDIVIKVDGADCSNQTVVCNKFNDYFISIAKNINDSISASNKSPLEYMGDRLPHSFFCLPATSDDVQKLLSSFVCKGCNLKSIPMFIYKYLSPVISPIISKINNISIEEGVFPDCLKTGRVVPLHKSGDATLKNNYRPITTLPVLSKLFEAS